MFAMKTQKQAILLWFRQMELSVMEQKFDYTSSYCPYFISFILHTVELMANLIIQKYKKMGKIFIIVLLFFTDGWAQEIQIATKRMEYLPEIRKDYSITYTQLYPTVEQHRPSNIITQSNLNNQASPSTQKNTNLNINSQPNPSNNKNQKLQATLPKSKPQKMFNKDVQFSQFHHIQFRVNKKYIVNNIDNRSVLNKQGKVVQHDRIQTPTSIEGYSLSPTQNQLHPPSTAQKILQITKVLKGNQIFGKQSSVVKLLFMIMLGISIIVLVFGYRPGDEKRKPYIPTNDDEQNALR